MYKELKLLRKIAGAAKESWDKGRLPLEDIHLKNLLTDYIDMRERISQPVVEADGHKQCTCASNRAGYSKYCPVHGYVG